MPALQVRPGLLLLLRRLMWGLWAPAGTAVQGLGPGGGTTASWPSSSRRCARKRSGMRRDCASACMAEHCEG